MVKLKKNKKNNPEIQLKKNNPEIQIKENNPEIQIKKNNPEIQIKEKDPEIQIKKNNPEIQIKENNPKNNKFFYIAIFLSIFIVYKNKTGSSYILTLYNLRYLALLGYISYIIYHYISFTNLLEKNKYIQIKQSFQINKLFYIAVLVSVFILYKNQKGSISFVVTLYTLFYVALVGYINHIISHSISFTDLLNKYIIFTEDNFFKKIIIKITSFLDFHRNIHHDTTINKQPHNVVYEFINNFIVQGVLPYLLFEFFKLLDVRVCFLWGFFYASVHNINYFYTKPKTHIQHHIDCHKNYGIDIFDIIFGSKYDTNEIEDMNHMGINLIICAIIFVYLNKYLNNLFNKFK